LDHKSFTEVESITGQPVFDERPESWSLSFLRMHTIFFFYVWLYFLKHPLSVYRNSVTGWGKLDGRKVLVTADSADNFSVRVDTPTEVS
jgi:hypothetical protein